MGLCQTDRLGGAIRTVIVVHGAGERLPYHSELGIPTGKRSPVEDSVGEQARPAL